MSSPPSESGPPRLPCIRCGEPMRFEHGHEKCDRCGHIASCCEGEMCSLPDPGARSGGET